MDYALDKRFKQQVYSSVIFGRMDINNVMVSQSSETLDDERTTPHFFKILWQGHPVAHRTNLKDVLEFRVIYAFAHHLFFNAYKSLRLLLWR